MKESTIDKIKRTHKKLTISKKKYRECLVVFNNNAKRIHREFLFKSSTNNLPTAKYYGV